LSILGMHAWFFDAVKSLVMFWSWVSFYETINLMFLSAGHNARPGERSASSWDVVPWLCLCWFLGISSPSVSWCALYWHMLDSVTATVDWDAVAEFSFWLVLMKLSSSSVSPRTEKDLKNLGILFFWSGVLLF